VTVCSAVVCEARADAQTACELADRLLCDAADWITPEVLGDYRAWRGYHAHDDFLLWKDVPRLARQRRIKAHGHFDGQPGAPDAVAARRVLLLLHGSDAPVHAVLLIRDDDGDPRRRQGLEQARNESKLAVLIILGVAHTKRECWVLAGFVPKDSRETDELERLRAELGFDPVCGAENLTAKDDRAKRSAKRVLDELCGGDKNREMECWREADLDTLADRGRQTGLADYMDEIRNRLVPLFTE